MSGIFPNQDYGTSVWKHKELPLLLASDFNFYRCLSFKGSRYGKTVSELHAGNLRESRDDNRYSKIFPSQKLSYWADSMSTARAEVKKWGASNDLLTFWAYDDASSTFPTRYPAEPLRIIDGIHFVDFKKILKKSDKGEELNPEEQAFVDRIAQEKPDCLAYKSEASKNGICFLFFEEGFKKLSLREVRLRLGDRSAKNQMTVVCADTSDYTPSLEGYGYSFQPIARRVYHKEYEQSEEFLARKKAYDACALRKAW